MSWNTVLEQFCDRELRNFRRDFYCSVREAGRACRQQTNIAGMPPSAWRSLRVSRILLTNPALSKWHKHSSSSVITNQPITITGITTDGKVRVFSGTVRSVEPGHALYPEYPLRITMPDSN